MKPLLIVALLFPAVTVYSQQAPPAPGLYTIPSLLEPLVYKLPSQDTGKVELYRKLQELQRKQKDGLITATFSHTTNQGKIYTLTPDHMPCLAPDMKAVAPMPNLGGFLPDDRMNAMPRQRIIPQEEKNRK
jgi:hypothetical protein